MVVSLPAAEFGWLDDWNNRGPNLTKITFLLGLAGSGKSHLADELNNKTGAKKFEGIAAPERAELLPAMIQCLMYGEDCVVEEIAYCRPVCREQVVTYFRSRVPSVEIEWICFENDLDSANWNVRNRTNKGDVDGHLGINQFYHGVYEYPAGANIIPITRTAEGLASNKASPADTGSRGALPSVGGGRG